MEEAIRKLDVSVHRRILTFLNAARTPEELMVPPPNEVLLIDERMMEADERLHHDEVPHDEVRNTRGHPGPARPKKAEPLIPLALAKKIIAARDEYSPLHGFRHISQLKEIPEFTRAILDKLIRLFSPRYRGRWELLYAGTN